MISITFQSAYLVGAASCEHLESKDLFSEHHHFLFWSLESDYSRMKKRDILKFIKRL